MLQAPLTIKGAWDLVPSNSLQGSTSLLPFKHLSCCQVFTLFYAASFILSQPYSLSSSQPVPCLQPPCNISPNLPTDLETLPRG